MASASVGRILWDPFRVLDLHPNDPQSLCSGVNQGRDRRGFRCGWRFSRNEQFDPSDLATANRRLEAMSEMHPSDITSAELQSLARKTLCKSYHQQQANEVEARWRALIQDYLREHGARLPEIAADRQLQSGIARDKAVYEREINEMRRALESSQVRCAELTDKYDRLAEKHSKLEEEQSVNSRDLAELRWQLTELGEQSTEIERLKRRMDEGDAKFERGIAASSRGIKGLKDGKARLDSMMTANTLEIVDLKAKVRDSASYLDERVRRSEEEAEDLRRRRAGSDREIADLKRAKASAEERAISSERDIESLRQGLRESNDRSEEKAKLSEREMESLRQRLRESNDRFEEKAKLSEREMEILRSGLRESNSQYEALRLDSAERGRHAGQLEQQMEGLKLELTERGVGRLTEMEIGEKQLTGEQEQLSALRAPKGKRGLFAVISKQPPRVLVRKLSKIMTTETAPYVQSAA